MRILIEVVPFLVEDMLAAQGGRYSKAADWQPHVVADRDLITGQNPASSAPAALALMERLREQALAASPGKGGSLDASPRSPV